MSALKCHFKKTYSLMELYIFSLLFLIITILLVGKCLIKDFVLAYVA